MSEVKESGPKHTAGPWASPGWVPTWAYIPVRSPAGLVCSVYPAGRDVDYMERAEANARLIAAAPDLLEALVASQGIEPLRMELEDCLPDEREALVAELQQIEAQVRAAIAKATGSDQ